MAPLKSPGSDGFGACLYQNQWSTIVDEVSNAILSALNGKSMYPFVIYTYLALIQKTKDPNMVSDYRPISLCNVLYKIM